MLKDMFRELGESCSKYNSNKGLRVFFLTFTIAGIVLGLLGVAMEVAAIVGVLSGVQRVIGFAFLPVWIIVWFAILAYMYKH